jgi:hypothetical protein
MSTKTLLRKLILYAILIVTELALGFLTIFCLQFVFYKLELGFAGQNIVRDISKIVLILLNIIWALKATDSLKRNKIIAGISSGIFVILVMFSINKFYSLDANRILTFSIIFGGQIILWEILFVTRFINFKSRKAIIIASDEQ